MGMWDMLHHDDDSLEKKEQDGKETVGGHKQVGAVGVEVDDEEGDKLWKFQGERTDEIGGELYRGGSRRGSRVQIEQPPAAKMCSRATFDTGSFSVLSVGGHTPDLHIQTILNCGQVSFSQLKMRPSTLPHSQLM